MNNAKTSNVVCSGQCTWLHLHVAGYTKRKKKVFQLNTKGLKMLAIYKHDQGVEQGSTKKQFQLSDQSGS